MILHNATLIGDGFTLHLGTFTHTATGTWGYTCVLDAAPAPLVLHREKLTIGGGIVRSGGRDAREFELSGTVMARTKPELADLWSDLTRALTPADGSASTLRYVVYGRTRQARVRVDGLVDLEDVAGGQGLDFTVRLVAENPVVFGAASKSVPLAAHPGAAAGNEGDAEVPVTFEIAGPPSGIVTALRVGNSVTGHRLDLTGLSFKTGDELVIDTTPGREAVQMNGTSIAGSITSTSRWPRLRPGTGKLFVTVTAGTGTPSGTAEWFDGWVS